jgi:hypothetical protein
MSQIGEDKAYSIIRSKYKGFLPIQLVQGNLTNYSVEEFASIMHGMEDRVVHFVHNRWDDYDDNLCEEIYDEQELSEIDCCKIKVLQLKYIVKTKAIYIIFNHENMGGGDFLEIFTTMLNGKTNTLLEEPTAGFTDLLKTEFAKMYCGYILVSNILLKFPIDRHKDPQIIQSRINTRELKSSIGTKFMLIHKIMTNIMTATKNTNNLVCWIPVGFKKSVGSPHNNIGIVVFTFVRDMTPSDVKDAIMENKMMAIGSRQLLIENYNDKPEWSSFIEQKLKQNIDVVLTMANIMENTVEMESAGGGMHYRMNINHIYPYYISCLTMDGVCHASYNVAHTSCDTEKLRKITNGSIITNKGIFSMNTKCDL